MNDLKLFKIALLTDMLDAELTNFRTEDLSKFRNLKKSTKIFVTYADGVFKQEDVQTVFSEFSDGLNKMIDEQLDLLK